jgi:6-phospho-beta-glucosidase
MKLTILGGGGFRVPLIYQALLNDGQEPRIDDVTLYDVDLGRLHAIESVLEQQASAMTNDSPPAPTVQIATSLVDAIAGTDFIFSAIRVGGLTGRSRDEHIALDAGALGQETTGPGGLAYGWRTVPVAHQIAQTILTVAPQAQVINFTNPAGMITEAMRAVLGDRVVGICDSPIGLARRAARALRIDSNLISPDYAGLNHLGWLRRLLYQGEDVLPQLLSDEVALTEVEEARLLGPDWVRSLGCLPNEYLYYFYYTRDAIASICASDQTRGDFLLEQQHDFYKAVADEPNQALHYWNKTRQQREETYLAEVRDSQDSRQEADIAGGGYERVALDYMTAVMRGETTTMILNVANGSALPDLPEDAVVEISCHVDHNGARPLVIDPLEGHQLGLVQQVKTVERLTIQASLEQNSDLMIKAFGLHPLVDSVSVARDLVSGYQITTTAA